MWLKSKCQLNTKRQFALSLAILLFLCVPVESRAGSFIVDVNTDKVAYSPGNGATIYVDITNSGAYTFSGSVSVCITHLGFICTNLPSQVIPNLGSHSTTTKMFLWTSPAANYQGYLVSVNVMDSSNTVVDSEASAIDVSSDWAKFPRYGYVAHYDSGLDAYNLMWQLKNYHINGVQFYDWQWKHHIPYSSNSAWPDIFNRTIYRSTLTNLINAAHSYGMKAMNYNSYGMAYADYQTDGSGVGLSMGVFSGTPASIGNQYGYPLSGAATTDLYEMNNRDTNWQNYIFGREQTVFTNFAFDGWHIDTVGLHTAYDYNGVFFSLDDSNPQFINNAKTALGNRMTFNTVDAGGENQVAQNANVDFVYSELWAGNPNYSSFKQRVDNVRSYCSKALVMPAYMNYGLSSGYFNEAGVRLADAAMFACGASHLELGDGDKMLHNEYFPNDASVLMTGPLTAAMHAYYDFLVGYENLLRGDTVSASNAASIAGVTTSADGAAGAVWVISKKTFGYNILQLVNLLNNTSTAWRDDNGIYASPPTLNNLAVKMYCTGSISGGRLWYATPDTNSCAAAQLSFTTGSDAGGNYINFTVPQLQYWDMIWLELNGTISAANQIQAENYDSMAGVSPETTTDIGGGLDVGNVKNANGDSYIAFNNIDFGTGPASASARVASAEANGVVEFHLDTPGGTLIATVSVGNTGGWQNWQTVNAAVSGVYGVHKLFVVFKNAASNLNWFDFNFSSLNNVLPSPWLTTDVGSVGVAGSVASSGGIFTDKGSGADIEGTADAFRYTYQTSSSNCEIRARMVSVQNTDPWAKAGVMVRENTLAGSANAAVVVTAANGVEFQWRNSTGGGTSSTVVSGVTAPEWVRLVRAGNSFQGYCSSDGTNWTQIGASQTITMTTNATVGLAVTAHNNATDCVASFDNVTVNNAPLLVSVSNQTIVAGATLVITNMASDMDVPAQTLTYSLPAAPIGASINASNGVFIWRPTIAQSPSTQIVSVVVTDSGLPPLSATQAFLVSVKQPTFPILNSVSISNGQFGFWINGDVGPDYTIQTSTNLASSWSALSTVSSPVLPIFWVDTNSTSNPVQFYRAILGP